MTGDPRKSPTGDEPSSRGERRKRVKRVRKTRKTEREPKESRTAFWIAVVIGTLLAAACTYLFVAYPLAAGPSHGASVELRFEKDEPLDAIVARLADAGMIRTPRVFSVYARLTGLRVVPGRHFLSDDAGPAELVRRLERSGGATRGKVVVPEGFNRFDIARRMEAQGISSAGAFLDATTDVELLREIAIDGESAEGFLFPATYEFPKDSDAREIVRRMKTEFERRFSQLEQNHRLGRANLEGSLGWGRREIVTMASMVEKEAAVDEERATIASVFLNRLRDATFKRKFLQCDPTAGYGCLVAPDRIPSCVGYNGKISHAINVDAANRYSTYAYEGLPPGPIANPGMKSLQAVLAPASTKYLYFVAREGRKHTFSESLDEHNAAVKDLRERRAAEH